MTTNSNLFDEALRQTFAPRPVQPDLFEAQGLPILEAIQESAEERATSQMKTKNTFAEIAAYHKALDDLLTYQQKVKIYPEIEDVNTHLRLSQELSKAERALDDQETARLIQYTIRERIQERNGPHVVIFDDPERGRRGQVFDGSWPVSVEDTASGAVMRGLQMYPGSDLLVITPAGSSFRVRATSNGFQSLQGSPVTWRNPQ